MKVDIIFFFSSRRRHTRLQGDWSSDVCSSDLLGKRWAWKRQPSMASSKLPTTAKDSAVNRAGNQSITVQADRKSTRLNSSHLVISYAVFCLKKKNTTRLARRRVYIRSVREYRALA